MQEILGFIEQIQDIRLDTPLLGNTVQEYLVAFGVFIAAALILYVFKSIVIRRLHIWSEKTPVAFDNALVKIVESYGWPLYIFIALFVAVQTIELYDWMQVAFERLVMLMLVYYVVYSLQQVIDYGFYQIIQQRLKEDELFDPGIIKVLDKVITTLLWIGGLLVVLQNFGFNVTTLLGGLGVGGIAIAFALQNVLSDIFASISIFFDKPFQCGDFIVVGDDMGTVEHIGIKSTRLKSLSGEQLVISNQELTSARVNNYQHMEERRIVFQVGVAYETSQDQLTQVKTMIQEVIEEQKNARFDRVHLAQFGDFSLIFEGVYFVLTSNYATYMDVQEQINFAIKERLEAEGIEIAYPTQKLYLHQNQ